MEDVIDCTELKTYWATVLGLCSIKSWSRVGVVIFTTFQLLKKALLVPAIDGAFGFIRQFFDATPLFQVTPNF